MHTVFLADALAKATGAGAGDGPERDAFARSLGELGLTPADFEELRVLVAQRLGEVEQRFN